MRTDHLVSETLERVRRIELLALAWKAKLLPLYDTRIFYCTPFVLFGQLFFRKFFLGEFFKERKAQSILPLYLIIYTSLYTPTTFYLIYLPTLIINPLLYIPLILSCNIIILDIT